MQRKCACGGTPGPTGKCTACQRKRLLGQPKLTINQPGDRYEQEADRVAEQVMRMPEPGLQRQAAPEEEEEELLQTKPLAGPITPLVQRQEEEEEEEDLLQPKLAVQRQARADDDATAPPVVHDVLRGPGQPLDRQTRAFMEPRFGHDFSRVRVHADARAASSARSVGAQAYTVGRNVVFGAGQYAPGTAEGKRLLAHELTHVVQQGQGGNVLQRTEDAEERHCGPEVTNWLIGQMNTNQNHPVIRTGRENRWVRWVPLVNIGWTGAAFYDFAQLVGPGKPWDFKRTQSWWRAANDRSCPTNNCDRTVTLCNRCVNYDVPGNIHFGWVGRRMEIAPWALHAGAGSVQEGNAEGDDPPDTVAINIGIAMADEGQTLCGQVRTRLNSLNRDRTQGCSPCASS